VPRANGSALRPFAVSQARRVPAGALRLRRLGLGAFPSVLLRRSAA
jgi:hypothetical protein